MYLVLFVLNDVNQCEQVVNAWEKAGVKGLTILASTGMGRLRNSVLGDDIPLFPSIVDLFKEDESLHRTFFTVTDDEEIIDKILLETEKIVGKLDEPNTGILIVVPVVRVHGLNRNCGDMQDCS